MSLFQGTIAKRVMAHMKKKIADAEKNYVDTCTKLDTQHVHNVRSLEVARDNAKAEHADKLVADILGK